MAPEVLSTEQITLAELYNTSFANSAESTMVLPDDHHYHKIPFEATGDFTYLDPWSIALREYVALLKSEGAFQGDLTEAGSGDARMAIIAEYHVPNPGRNYRGIEYEAARNELARRNLRAAGLQDSQINLVTGDVVDIIQNLPYGEKITGAVIACLPQVPNIKGMSVADGYKPLPSLKPYKSQQLLESSPLTADQIGFTLLTAFLSTLRGKVDTNNFEMLLLPVAHRIPEQFHQALFARTGWEIDAQRTVRVQQDPKTSLKSHVALDPHFSQSRYQPRFYDGLGNPLTAAVAENLRTISANDGGRNTLGVHHDLTIYKLRPSVGTTRFGRARRMVA